MHCLAVADPVCLDRRIFQVANGPKAEGGHENKFPIDT